MTHSPNDRPAMNEPLLEIKNLLIDGESDEVWHEIIKGLDLTLNRGEVLGLIGESGAGKSTLGLAAMNFVRPGCRIRGGTIRFDGEELTKQSETVLRKLRGVRIAYVAQSAAASFNPAHQLIDQFSEIPVVHGVKIGRTLKPMPNNSIAGFCCLILRVSGIVIRTRSLVVNCKEP